MELRELFLPIMCALVAGVSTAIGGILAVAGRKPEKKMLSIGLGAAVGILIYLAFGEILPDSFEHFSQTAWGTKGAFLSLAIFLVSVAMAALIDHLVPGHDIHHEHGKQHEMCEASAIYKIGIRTALALSMHNLTEGIAIFSAVLAEPRVALPVVLSVMVHNIPCGMTIAMPIYTATEDKKRAVMTALKTGLVTPVGAALTAILLHNVLTDATMGILMAIVAGVMVFTAVFELFPLSKKYGKCLLSILSAVGGALCMAIILSFGVHGH